jgi:small subunit ribosomal protein S6e
MTRQKAPKIQRLVTETRLRRKRINKEDKIKRWKKTTAQAEEFKKLHDTWAAKKRAEVRQLRKASRVSASSDKKKEEAPKKVVVPTVTKTVAAKAPKAPKAPTVTLPKAVAVPAKTENNKSAVPAGKPASKK